MDLNKSIERIKNAYFKNEMFAQCSQDCKIIDEKPEAQ
jgi:hypothetical protein